MIINVPNMVKEPEGAKFLPKHTVVYVLGLRHWREIYEIDFTIISCRVSVVY
jgi:hypothetical protein